MSIDALFYAIGYEERSGFIASKQGAKLRVGFEFQDFQDFSFATNRAAADARSDEVVPISDFQSWLTTEFIQKLDDLNVDREQSLTVGIDISSLNRVCTGGIISFLSSLDQWPAIDLSILYAPAQFAPPPEEHEPVVDISPLPMFEGWSSEPELPLALVLGLGYEEDIAIGSVEYLDPSGVWAFCPRGRDDRFRAEVEKANSDIWTLVPAERRIDYDVTNPDGTFAALKDLCFGLKGVWRVAIVPGGPKIFSALSMLVQREMGDEVSVWRASRHAAVSRRDVQADQSIVSLNYKVRRNRSSLDSIY